jgi:uncharacterized protein DUF1592/uncharacterized protein DUF1588/uncharacterized protein DUF1587/uncharacterized protein DUF1595/uncharacterized protein DUF1585/predicted xylan-binding protein with Ca-dependent carbohydrate-binding module
MCRIMRPTAVASSMLLLTACLAGQILAPPKGDGSSPGTPGAPGSPDDPSMPGQPADPCAGSLDPGHVTIHRLNRPEYNNTVRDLLADTSEPANDFPADDQGAGFDNNADVLSISPLLAEKYQIAAEHLIENALRVGVGPADQKFSALRLGGSVCSAYGSYWDLCTNGTVSTPISVPLTALYRLSVRAFGQQAGPDPARMTIQLDEQPLDTFDVTADEAMPAIYTKTVTITMGMHTFDAAFINDYYDPQNADPAQRDRNLVIDYLELEGPLNAPPPNTDGRRLIMICDPANSTPDDCGRRIISAFAKRAWRRPVAAEEVDRLLALARVPWMQGDAFDTGIRIALEAVLLSPHFLFRVELDPDPNAPSPHALGDYELASRLSYFLWSTMPDEALVQKADAHELSNPDVVKQEVARMLRDPKATSFVENFAGQWLYTRAMNNVSPDYATYPDFDEALRAAAKNETHEYFRWFLTADEDARDLIDSQFTFVNDRLARHYGLPQPSAGAGMGMETRFARVDTTGTVRGGLLTQTSILTVTSNAKRTSPVRRGKWVFEQLLCGHVPPPPPDAGPLAEPPMGTQPMMSLRQRMEQHRRNPRCASCHQLMDPIGFGLENFDGIGAWRTTDSGFAIDATGTLPDGRAFDGPRQLAALIKTDPALTSCMIQRLFTYALGRQVTGVVDTCHVDKLDKSFAAANYRLSALVAEMTTSPPFVTRRAETATTSTGGGR